jgi:hypothetical protein
MSDDDYPHLIQYRDPITGYHRSTALCAIHEADLLRGLHRVRVGCIATNAPHSARCDRCEDHA